MKIKKHMSLCKFSIKVLIFYLKHFPLFYIFALELQKIEKKLVGWCNKYVYSAKNRGSTHVQCTYTYTVVITQR